MVLVRLGQLLLGVAQVMLLMRPPDVAVDLDSTVRFCGIRYSYHHIAVAYLITWK